MKKIALLLLFALSYGAVTSNSSLNDAKSTQGLITEFSTNSFVINQKRDQESLLIAQNEPKKNNPESSKDSDDESYDDPISSFLGSNTVLYFFIGVLIPLGLFVILAISVKKKLPKKED